MPSISSTRLLLVGNPESFHVGAHLLRAAQALDLEIIFCDARRAFRAPRPLANLFWRFAGHRPVQLRRFSQSVMDTCRRAQPTLLLATGLAPLDEASLRQIGELGIARLNFLTDDPWNPAHRAAWFLSALARYDFVFSPRRANLRQLQTVICKNASYLPFAYDPDLHRWADEDNLEPALGCDLLFVGGADADRVPYLTEAAKAGFELALYGGYWERVLHLRPSARGHADPAILRRATRSARVNLCLVRRANRDGHVMRSFEIPAGGGCMLAEDTEEHRQIFGREGECVLYFRTIPEMVEKTRWLLDHPEERQRLRQAAYRRIVIEGRNTYRDRLETMLDLAGNQR